jgi:hypothetical protein
LALLSWFISATFLTGCSEDADCAICCWCGGSSSAIHGQCLDCEAACSDFCSHDWSGSCRAELAPQVCGWASDCVLSCSAEGADWEAHLSCAEGAAACERTQDAEARTTELHCTYANTTFKDCTVDYDTEGTPSGRCVGTGGTRCAF